MTSCAPAPTPQRESVDGTMIRLDSDRIGSGRVYNFILKDGTHCIYVDGIREGGLSCDFTLTRIQ